MLLCHPGLFIKIAFAFAYAIHQLENELGPLQNHIT